MAELLPVEFRSDTLFLVEHEGEPFTPARTIVDSIGLNWKTQHRKLQNNNLRWSVVEMTTVAKDGRQRRLVCMPVRKLPAFLATIQPNKVKPELREKIIQYQNECDDVLWEYWMQNQAARHNRLSPENCRTLQEEIARIASDAPEGSRKAMYATLWGRIKSKFRVPTYRDLRDDQFDEVMAFVRGPIMLRLPEAEMPDKLWHDTAMQMIDELGRKLLLELGEIRYNRIARPRIEFVRRCLVRVWTECDESASRIAVAYGHLRRWTSGHEVNAFDPLQKHH